MNTFIKSFLTMAFLSLFLITGCQGPMGSSDSISSVDDTSTRATAVTGSPVGWGESVTGGSGTSVTVDTYSELVSALDDDSKKIIYIDGTINISSRITIQDRSDFSIIGKNNARLVSTNTTRDGSGIFYIKRVTNMILQNVTFEGPGAYDTDGWDNLCLDNCQYIWVDHCDFQDGVDGNFDIKSQSNYISVTWTIFQYKKPPIAGGPGGSDDHRYTNLIGSSDSATADAGKLKVTFYYCQWGEGCVERMPRVRYGQIHILNSLFDSSVAKYCVRAAYKSNILVEGSYFDNQAVPIDLYSGYSAVKAINNYGQSNMSAGSAIFTPAYTYSAASATSVPSAVRSGAGATLGNSAGGSTGGSTTTTTGLYPAKGATNAYTDGALSITFDSKPTLSSSGKAYIYKANGTLVDTIKFQDEIQTAWGTDINVDDQLARVEGSKLYLTPHFGKLAYNTEYYVVISSSSVSGKINGSTFSGFGAGDWSFKTKSEPSLKASNITVNSSENSTANYRTIQKALDTVSKLSETDITINVAAGTYNEFIYYKGGKSITIAGPNGNNRGDNCVIQYSNSQAYNSSTHTRALFYFSASNLVLKNITLNNTYVRNTANAQAEAIYFANASYGNNTMAAYNSTFKSNQDTINSTGRLWFYDCYIEGDVDFIWGYADVALFEECDLVSLYDSYRGSSVANTILVSRTGSTSSSTIGKGYVLLNSKVKIENGVTNYYGRNPGGSGFYDQCAVINTDFTGNQSSSLWQKSSAYSYIGNGSNVGWKDYGNTINGSPISTSSRLSNTATLSSSVYNAEYSSRDLILNRVYNISSSAYQAAGSKWNISALESDFASSSSSSSGSSGSNSDDTLVTWDFTSGSTNLSSIEGTTGTVSSDVSGVSISVDATSGKLAQRTSDAQCNSGTILSIPVSNGSIVKVVAYTKEFTINGTVFNSGTYTYTYKGSSSSINLVATANNYIYSIVVDNSETSDIEPVCALGVTVSGSDAILNWNISDFTATKILIYRDTDSDPTGRVKIGSATGLNSYTDSGLAEGTYYYWVKAYNAAGDIINSNGDDAKIEKEVACYLGVSVSGTTATLNWSYVNFNPTSQAVYRDTDSNPSGRVRVGYASGTSFTDSGLTSGQTYYYWIKATDSSGAVINSNGDDANIK